MSASAIQRNGVQVLGQGSEALVFGHGFGTDQRAWRYVAPAFTATHRVVLFDHVGFGASDRSAWADSRHGALEGYAQDLLDILDALGLQRVSYVGHSAGGMIGLLASIRQPARFERLVLLGTSPRFINDPPGYFGGFERGEIEGILDALERDQLAWSETLAPMAIGAQNSQELVHEFGNGLRALDPLIARAFGRTVFTLDCRDRLAQVSVPALVVQCTQDSIVPREVGTYLHRHLAGSVLREIDASGHCPHLTHPQQITALIREYLGASSG